MTVGERIRQRRIELGLTQEELAKRLGYASRSSVNKMEVARDLPLKKVEAMANALMVTPSYLMGWEADIELLPGIMEYVKLSSLTDLFEATDDIGQDMIIESAKLIQKVHPRKEEPALNAAHERTDIKVTEAMRKHDDDIMSDEDF